MNKTSGKAIKVLIIEDDDVTRMSLTNVLKKNGYITSNAENGNTGISVFKTEKPDVVITDILMPDKEGLETISEILSINPTVKIIAMSGGGTTQNMTFLKMAKKLGADILLNKPIKPEQLLSAINSLWEQ